MVIQSGAVERPFTHFPFHPEDPNKTNRQLMEIISEISLLRPERYVLKRARNNAHIICVATCVPEHRFCRTLVTDHSSKMTIVKILVPADDSCQTSETPLPFKTSFLLSSQNRNFSFRLLLTSHEYQQPMLALKQITAKLLKK